MASFAIILAGCEIFTNSVEWLGYKLNLSEGTTGSVLAALGTAMPETFIPVLALIFGSSAEIGKDISLGTILGSSFMLTTLTMFGGSISIVIFSLLGKRERMLNLDTRNISLDYKFFIILYSIAFVAGLISSKLIKLVLAAVLAAAYLFYLQGVLKVRREENSNLPRCLYLCRLGKNKEASPHIVIVLIQLFFALGMIITGARFFVYSVEALSIAAGISVVLLSFLIAPFATELPETINSIIWYYRNKDTLALSNITGALVFQSSIVLALGITLTDWNLGMLQRLSMLLVLASAGLFYSYLKWRGNLHAYVIMMGGLFYMIFFLSWLYFF